MTFNLLKKINNKLFSDSVIYGLSGTFVASSTFMIPRFGIEGAELSYILLLIFTIYFDLVFMSYLIFNAMVLKKSFMNDVGIKLEFS